LSLARGNRHRSEWNSRYWVNRMLEDRAPGAAELAGALGAPPLCINAAIEESRLETRRGAGLMAQDELVRDRLSEHDVLVLSVGGNDIALGPTPLTVVNMALLTKCTPACCIARGCGCPPDTRRCCADGGGSCTGCAMGCCGLPSCLGYFVHMFANRVEALARKIISKRKPRVVMVCMLYYLDQKPGGSWADGVLSALGCVGAHGLGWLRIARGGTGVTRGVALGCARWMDRYGAWRPTTVAVQTPSARIPAEAHLTPAALPREVRL